MGATGVRKAESRAVGESAAAGDEDILRLMGRFGVARVDQIARWLGGDEQGVRRQVQGLAARGLLRVLHVEARRTAVAAFALSAAGKRRLPALLPKQRVHTRQVNVLLATLDLAADLREREGAEWLTWPEALREGLALPPPGTAPAEGLVCPPAAARDAAPRVPVPACVVLRRQARRTLRERLVMAARACGGVAPRIFAPEHLCPELLRQAEGTGARVEPWDPVPPPGLAAAGTGVHRAAAPGDGGAGRGRAVLTPKRERVLRLLAAFGYATVDQVAREQGSHSTAASIMLASLEKAGLVQRHRTHHLHKDVYSPTELGIAASGLGLPMVPRVPAQRRHALALVDLAHHLVAESGGEWQTQREIADRWGRRPELIGVPVPDGLLMLPDGRRAAVELELSSQPRHAVLDFIAAQKATATCDEIWYVVSPEWERRYAARLAGMPAVVVRSWEPPDRLGGPRGFRADRVTREPSVPRILGRARRQ